MKKILEIFNAQKKVHETNLNVLKDTVETLSKLSDVNTGFVQEIKKLSVRIDKLEKPN